MLKSNDRIKVREEMDVIMGLRTEDLTMDNGHAQIPDAWKVEGKVEIVEPLGGETHLHMDFYDVPLIAKSEGRKVFTTGESLRMVLDLNHLHLFDARTTLSIY